MRIWYELCEIKDWEEITEKEEWTKTRCVINATGQVGLASITEKNLPTWKKRVRMVEEAGMALTTFHSKPAPMPLEWLDRRVGLQTNETNLSDKKFRELLTKWKEANPSEPVK